MRLHGHLGGAPISAVEQLAPIKIAAKEIGGRRRLPLCRRIPSLFPVGHRKEDEGRNSAAARFACAEKISPGSFISGLKRIEAWQSHG
jgi:hypothetical protein